MFCLLRHDAKVLLDVTTSEKKTEWKTNEKHQNGEKVYIIKLSSVSCAAAATWQARKGID